MKTLDDLIDADRFSVGGKVYNCARLRRAGFPVPDGLVVPAEANDGEVASLPADAWFDAQPHDATYAVRSSGIDEDGAGHSFAGVHETRLNVPRAHVTEAVLACRRSAQSEQAAVYRRSHHLEGGGAISVLVQRMVPAMTSGVAFTVNPVTRADELVINAASGLGEALVSGHIDPDEFIVSKREGSITSARPGAGRGTTILTPQQIGELAALLVDIEKLYGSPQDVEFCHDGRQFWIVQSRPVTTVPGISTRAPSTLAPSTRAPSTRAPSTSARTSTQHPAPSTRHPDIEWTRANLAEVLPEHASPQVLAAYEEMLNRGQRLFLGRLLTPEAVLGPMCAVFHGRMYFNLSQARRIASLAGAPAAAALRSFGHSEQIRPEDEQPVRASAREIVRVIPDFLRIAFNDLRLRTVFRAHARRTERALERIRAHDPATLSDRQLWEAFDEWIASAPEALQPVFAMSVVLFRESQIRKACRTVGADGDRLIYTYLAAGERSVSGQQAIDLAALVDPARSEPSVRRYLSSDPGTFADYRAALAGTAFIGRFDQFLDQYGHRGRFESDWSLPRLHEDPASALFAIREQMSGSPLDVNALSRRQQLAADESWNAFVARATWWQRLTLVPRVQSALRRLKHQYVWRERVRSDLTRIMRYARPYHLELARRFTGYGWIDEPADYFLIRLPEIGLVVADPANGAGLKAIVAARKTERDAERELDMPLLMRESERFRVARRRCVPDREPVGDLTGLCVSPGAVEAEVIVLSDPGQFALMKRGAILVTRATDPSWTPLFTLAAGVVVEVGGMLSHASTIAREYGLPALANVRHATTILKNGDRVRLDASGGRVTVLESARR